MGQLRIMGTDGDKRIAWDTADKAQTKVAQDHFDALIKAGYVAYRADSTEVSAPIKSFVPEAQKVVMFRSLAGG